MKWKYIWKHSDKKIKECGWIDVMKELHHSEMFEKLYFFKTN